jgi:hypothetical protein
MWITTVLYTYLLFKKNVAYVKKKNYSGRNVQSALNDDEMLRNLRMLSKLLYIYYIN